MNFKEREVEPVNSMVTSFEDMEILGRQMERQRTNEELMKHERQPDPVQYDEAIDGKE
ncbi:hypothetical protein [Domibacillus enclensis]|uniref:Uncharacterized protein n=1 Tax=Domibacillus enclensis TaxID=1017273 RepID=A0A1N7B4U9_9BACI|nr:hypothetical protein [Domibacillus enclensis]SIR46312.1 hypothetical protein SAMN05443094_108145 [Domibacillus enclensis]